jgi:nucleotide-binding universal stress UspA family protein
MHDRRESAPPATEDRPAMLSSIVVPLDGSDLARTAIPVGEQLARALGATLSLLTSGWGSTVEELEASLAAEAARVDVPTSISVVPDTFPATAIAHAVAGTDDAVVMATHGRSGIGKALLGSVAEDLLKATERPVLLLGPSAAPLPDITGGVMVVSTDGSPTSAAILPKAARWAKALDLSVRVVSVTKDDGTPLGSLDHDDLAARMQAAADFLRSEGLTVEVETLTGTDAARALVELVERLPASILAMSTHARTGWSRTALGSVAMKVVHDSPCPVLVQKPAG